MNLTTLNTYAILIAMGDKFNQQLDLRVLSDRGFDFYLADNGKQAIEMLRENPQIELVLMDCRMPVLDGFEATTLIRSGYAGDDKQHIPIIAMTASAMSEDREACLIAGMNDYLSQPISADDMEAKITIWLDARDKNQAHASVVTQQSTDTMPFWDKEASLVRVLSNQALFIQLLDMFEQQTPGLIDELDVAINDYDREQIRLKAHKLKGSAAAVGANAVLADARQLEKAIYEVDAVHIKRLAANLKADIEKMYLAIEQYKRQKYA